VSLERFNFDTMSGVYPGTRTQVFQRVLLHRIHSQDVDADAPARTWALFSWYEDPAACIVAIEGEEKSLRIETPNADRALETVRAALAAQGWDPYVCGTCHHWQAGAGTSVDGLPLGRCTLQRAGATVSIPLLLGAQSALALGCDYWVRETGTKTQPEASVDANMLPMHPLPKIAEISESKMKPMRRLRVRLKRWLSPPPPAPTLDDHLVERSGVGAGTEPCPCCQGRIANLGALAVQDEATDKQTLSVWRCRVCHALYLSDWVDRWERVDSLETEETIYRIAPIEAAEMLTLIASVHEAEHPRRRTERTVERAWMLAQVAGREPVSHVIKQGR
jgi:hypothetical protein